MPNILLVDDEPRQLRAMSTIIKSLRPHYNMFTAQDGSEALALIAQISIDVVMTDIRMPVMDGMELLTELTRQYYGGKLVLITGYGDFNYAQQAIRMGIFDYIVKPIGKSDLENLLDKLDQVLQTERLEASKLVELTRQINVSIPAYRQQLVLDWLQGVSDGAELRAQSQMEGAVKHGLLIIMQSSKHDWIPERDKEIGPLLLESIQYHLNELSILGSLSLEADRRIVMIAGCQKYDPLLTKRIQSALEIGLTEFHSEHEMVWTIGCVLLNESSWTKGRACYEQADKALDGSFVLGIGRVIIYNESVDGKRTIDVFEQEEHFSDAIQSGNVEQINKHINGLLEAVKEIAYPKPLSIKEDCVRLIMNRLKEAKHLLSKESYTELSEQFQNNLLLCGDYIELRLSLKNAAMNVAELYRLTNEDKNSVVIQKCRAYIQEHYQEDISLESAAHMFHFNASYFSTLFKAHTGMNLTDYIVSIRVDKAQQLLLHSPDKIVDIAKKIGYKDVGYFIRIFKREKGISPKKFRGLAGKE
jgi:two-component system response regulator YesN